jgi:hypothetical protein
MSKMKRSGLANLILASTVPEDHRLQALLNFEHFDKPKNGENIGAWLEDSHESVGCKAEYIGSHTVDGASNAGKSVRSLEWNTRGQRSQKIVATKCDSHNINTTSQQASGTSSHKINLNPELGRSLKQLHLDMTKLCNYGACKNILGNVRHEHGRVKYPAILYSAPTRWESSHAETASANANQYDVEVALKRIKAPGGVQESLRDDAPEDEEAEEDVLLEQSDYNLFYQYESGMTPLKRYSESSQSMEAIGHEELFMGRECIEKLRAPYFKMFENISKKMGNRGGSDLTVSS